MNLARSMLQKSHQLDDSVLAGAARLRARALALLHGALRQSKIDQVTLARRLGVRKSAVNAVLQGNGNVRINTLAEYMAVMGLEIDMVATELGELDRCLAERRAPRHVVLTLADADRHDSHPHHVVIFSDTWSVRHPIEAPLHDANTPTARDLSAHYLKRLADTTSRDLARK